MTRQIFFEEFRYFLEEVSDVFNSHGISTKHGTHWTEGKIQNYIETTWTSFGLTDKKTISKAQIKEFYTETLL